MKRLFLQLFIMFFTISAFCVDTKFEKLLSKEELDYISKKPEVVVGFRGDWPPYEFYDSTGNLKGFVVDYFEKVVYKTGIKYHFVQMDWSDVYQGLVENKIDIAPDVQRLPEREDLLFFTPSYNTIRSFVVCRDDYTSLKSFGQLKGKALTVLNKWAMDYIISEKYPGIKLVRVNNFDDLIGNVLLGKTDATIIHEASLEYFSHKYKLNGLRVAFVTPYVVNISIGVRKNDTILFSIINKAANSLAASDIQSIHDKWFSVKNRNFSEIAKYAAIIIAILIIGLVLIFLWVFFLRRQVKIKTHQLHEQIKTVDKQNTELTNYKSNLEEIVRQKTSDLEEAVKELEKSQIMLNSFIYQSIEGIAITDETGKIIVWNESIAKITGIHASEALTKYSWEIESEMMQSQSDILSFDDIKVRTNAIFQNLKEKMMTSYTGVIKTRNGELKHIDCTIFIINTPNGNFYGQVLKDVTEKKKNEAELEQYQLKLEKILASQTEKSMVLAQHLSYVFENATDYIAIFEISNNKIILANCNSNWAKSLGSTVEQVIGKPVEKIFNSNAIAKIFVIDSFNKKQTSFLEAIEFIEGDKVRYLDITAIPISELSDQVALFARDVTESKLAYRRLQDSENKLFNIFNNSLDTISLIDYETREYIDVNNAYYQNIGLKREDVIGKTREDINLWTNAEEYEQYEKLLERNNHVQNLEIQWNVRSVPHYFLVSTEILVLNSRKILLTTSRDINEFKKVSIALKESEEKFRNIFNSSADGILLLGFNKQIIDANISFYKPLGYTLEEALGAESYLKFVKPDYHSLLTERFSMMQKGLEVPIIELEIISKSGSFIYFELNSKVINYGHEGAILVLARDISERKKIEQKILLATIEAEERERRKLAADLHDEVGPLLSSMNMNLSLLARKQISDDKREMINEVTSILKNTIGTVREISHNISPQVLSTYGLASAINAFISDKKKLIAINFENTLGNRRFLEVKELMLYRIVKELVNNTLKYANSTEINMSLEETNSQVRFCFQDNGKGFNPDELSLKPNKGLGLLNIINRVNTIGGKYNLNTAPGKGFQLEVTFNIDE